MGKGIITTSLALIVSSILTFSLFTIADTHFLLKYCKTTPNNKTIPNTSLSEETSLQTLLKSLASHAPPKGYFHTSVVLGVGDYSDRINGQALCRGDINPADCRKCLEEASHGIIEQCNWRTVEEAIVWYETCQIRYSHREFSNVMRDGGKVPEDENYYRKSVTGQKEFGQKLSILMEKLVNRKDTLGDPEIMYAAGEVQCSEKRRIYGLVQCTRDLSGEECKKCLNGAWADLKERSGFKEGGVLLSANCNIRFEIFPFYNKTSSFKVGHKWKTWKVVAVASCASLVSTFLVFSLVVYLGPKRKSQRDHVVKSESALMQSLSVIDLATISTATDGFSILNRLGQGGFGTVYKGVMPDGKEVAVKRLSRRSCQGIEEFKNEVLLIAKLQHRNLVRLLGCAVEGDEKLLVYEFMPNKSLDSFIFDLEKRSILDWKIRFNIICGIARGLLYLHEDSRLKIIHRDLKPSNVLLDGEMVPKISDFGLARIFCEDQNSANTGKVVGTYGYMAPEYAMEGQFSVKSDVYSFGVILLEIISGKKSNSFENSHTFIRYAWQVWKGGKEMEFVDPMLMDSGPTEEARRCMHIGLLCMQADPAERPTMSSVVVMLESGLVSLPKPSQPAFSATRLLTPITHQLSSSNIF